MLLLTGEPISTRWTPAIKAEIKQSRVGVTRTLVVSALAQLLATTHRPDPVNPSISADFAGA